MNTMTHALQTAGIKTLSQIQLTWTWLKDHPNKTAREVETALKFSGTSSTLAQLRKRGMVTCKPEQDARNPMPVNRYTAVGTEYELKPMPKKVKPVKPSQFTNAAGLPIAASSAVPVAPVPAAPADFNLDTMTIADARKLYKQLHRMFGGA